MTQPDNSNNNSDQVSDKDTTIKVVNVDSNSPTAVEKGGPSGPEPTRFGDWERKGRCIDF